MRWYSWFAIACLPIGATTLAAAAWFGSSGTGEYRNSPDGKFVASANNLSRGTLFNGRIQYIGLRVVESTSDRELWHSEFFHDANLKVPNYGDRSQPPSIDWKQDSSAVTIPIGRGKSVTLPVK
jgi:hypothetical protein